MCAPRTDVERPFCALLHGLDQQHVHGEHVHSYSTASTKPPSCHLGGLAFGGDGADGKTICHCICAAAALSDSAGLPVQNLMLVGSQERIEFQSG